MRIFLDFGSPFQEEDFERLRTKSLPFHWSKVPLENLKEPLSEKEIKEDGQVLYIHEKSLYYGVYLEEEDEVLREKIIDIDC